jgi:hypothetical protein
MAMTCVRVFYFWRCAGVPVRKDFLLETDVVLSFRDLRAIAQKNNSALTELPGETLSPYLFLFFFFLKGSTLPFSARRGKKKRDGDGSCGGS